MTLEEKREYDRESSKRYRDRHPERARANVERYRKKHLEVCCERAKRWHLNHPEWRTNYYIKNKEEILARHKRRKREIKEEVFKAYGGAFCSCCGETIVEFLTIDHINGNGAEHRKELGKSYTGTRFYYWLMRKNYPPGFQVLCFNCNCAKSILGYCPHKGEKSVNSI